MFFFMFFFAKVFIKKHTFEEMYILRNFVVVHFAFTISFIRSGNETIESQVTGNSDAYTSVTIHFNSSRFD